MVSHRGLNRGSFFAKGKERGGVGSLDQGCDVKEEAEAGKSLVPPTALHARGSGLLEAM